jgi:hypothetical protein
MILRENNILSLCMKVSFIHIFINACVVTYIIFVFDNPDYIRFVPIVSLITSIPTVAYFVYVNRKEPSQIVGPAPVPIQGYLRIVPLVGLAAYLTYSVWNGYVDSYSHAYFIMFMPGHLSTLLLTITLLRIIRQNQEDALPQE